MKKDAYINNIIKQEFFYRQPVSARTFIKKFNSILGRQDELQKMGENFQKVVGIAVEVWEEFGKK